MKVRIDELETELALMKEEMEGATGGGGAPAGNSVQIKALEQQNEKLKEGLIKWEHFYLPGMKTDELL